jgi:hypothetical protein
MTASVSGALALALFEALVLQSPARLFLAVLVVPFTTLLEAVFVIPIMVVWPATRYLQRCVATIWGGLIAVVAVGILWYVQMLRTSAVPFGLIQAIPAGCAAGFTYATLTRRAPTTPESPST